MDALKTSQKNPFSHIESGKWKRADILRSTKSLLLWKFQLSKQVAWHRHTLCWKELPLALRSYELLLKDFNFIYCLLSWQAQWSEAPLALMNRGRIFLGNFTNEEFLIQEIVVGDDSLSETSAFLDMWLRLLSVTPDDSCHLIPHWHSPLRCRKL